ncbi:DUF421 domain-containing protein [Parvularcula dongshanensis]|uniref:Uncharacterized membrane protein YcaP (DUF421 family) n=1 Tax=Parvularcula dongshanensis TaxID=1173995 RepID=A0A840I6C0_9PROT|nr:YetF domain-containing protein [Parvularcula dongshanensis]MBB4659560.1 uncharacterized membrane protein YcaP (DUF421 family) [Parvularcula dongshanensis]
MQDAPLFFPDWAVIGRTVILGLLSYVAIVVLLRLSGKRTLSKFNMFDFVITIAFGSVLASMLTSKSVTLGQGVVAFAMLIGLQACVTFASVRSSRFQDVVKATPAILYYRGAWREDLMKRERVTKEELEASVRQSGKGGLDRVGALILETDGTISVIGTEELGDERALPPGAGR